MILTVKLVFTAATLAFMVGFSLRRSNNALHRRLMLLGALLTAGIAVVLVAGVYIFGETYGPAGWLVEAAGSEARARGVLVAHRLLATVTLVCLLTQVVAGLRRSPLHKRLYKAVIPLWFLTYGSGLVVFV
ncbi:MAG: DUF420 domain-containing protein [bacterium]